MKESKIDKYKSKKENIEHTNEKEIEQLHEKSKKQEI